MTIFKPPLKLAKQATRAGLVFCAARIHREKQSGSTCNVPSFQRWTSMQLTIDIGLFADTQGVPSSRSFENESGKVRFGRRNVWMTTASELGKLVMYSRR